MNFGWERIRSLLKKNKEIILLPEFSDPQTIWINLVENGKNVSFQNANDDIQMLANLSNAFFSEDQMRLGIHYPDIYAFYYDEDDNPIEDYQLLNLPPLFDGMVFIENNGNFAETEQVTFQFKFKDGREHDIRRLRENIVLVDGQEKVISLEMYECLKLVTQYNQDAQLTKNIASQFELLASIKDYAEKTNIALNRRLSLENKPIILDKIKLDFKKTPAGLEIKPLIVDKDETFNEAFVSAFDRQSEIKNFYTVKDKDKDVKVIIKNKESAKKMKRNRLLIGEKEKAFYRGDNELLKDEYFDPANYGPRVKGLGYLNYRAIASPSHNTDESWFDFAEAFEPPALYTDELVHPWRPEDQERLQAKLQEMEKNQSEHTELEIEHGGETFTVPLTQDEFSNEINKITEAIVDPRQIKSIKDLREINEKCKEDPKQLYIEHKGRFIKNFGQEMFENHIKHLTEAAKRPKDKQKDPTLLIKDNLTELEHTEKVFEKPQMFMFPYEPPSSLKIILYEHQVEGVHRLQSLYRTSTHNGFLLADDMGLGKTIQILAFLAWLKERKALSPSLIVAPSTLINNWDNDDPNQLGEIQKFFQPHTFKTYKIQGTKKDSSRELEIISQSDLVFITYESLRLNHIWLGKVHWKCIVCDEVQAVKNPKTLVSVALKAQHGDFKIACSATPIENTTEDLWNILDFAIPGVLGSLSEFKRKFVKTIDILRPDQNDERRVLNDTLMQKIEGNFLRRSKEDKLKDLPQKKVMVNLIEANDEERQRIAELNRLRQQGEPPLALIQKLIASCSHPRIDSNSDINHITVKDLVSESSKLAFLKEILDSIRMKNEKVIIFTMFRQMQMILYKVIGTWYGIHPSILNGTLSPDKRSKIISEFRRSQGFNIIILSPLAAGVGITLTEANHVIHYTRMWNPAKEAQATDRVYRIGQHKDVYVYYPMLSFENSSTMKFENEHKYLEYFLNEATIGKTPDEKLNRLLVKKKNMLNNFFLAAGNSSADIIEEWDEEVSSPLSIEADFIERVLKSNEFEAACSLLFRRLGYNTHLMVNGGNSSVAVVIEKDGKYGLIHCDIADKLAQACLDKIYGAKNIYANQLNVSIEQLIVITTGEKVTDSLNEWANIHKITLFLRNDLSNLLAENPIFYTEIIEEDRKRFSIELLKSDLAYSN